MHCILRRFDVENPPAVPHLLVARCSLKVEVRKHILTNRFMNYENNDKTVDDNGGGFSYDGRNERHG
jgi:hypothetical protein